MSSRDTNVFKGVLSWISSIILLILLSGLIGFGITVLFDNDFSRPLAELIIGLRYYPTRFGVSYTWLALVALFIFSMLVLLLALTFLFRRDRKAVEQAIGRGFGHIWMEPKVIVLAIILFANTGLMLEELFYHSLAILIISLPVYMLCLYFFCLDRGTNHRYFSHNIIHTIIKAIAKCNAFDPLEKKGVRRALAFCCIPIFFLGISGFFFLIFIWGFNYYIDAAYLLVIVPIAIGCAATIGAAYWYINDTRQRQRELTALAAQIAEMYGGNLDAINRVSPGSDLYHSAVQLNMIRTGLEHAVREGVKADRTKVELITNVSHDLKTPLTSIISYTELLKKEADLPEQARDYVNIISQKATRLSEMIQDVFDISKAATGNIPLNLEDLDLGRLLRQTFAELEEVVSAAPITWRLDIPETPFIIHSDGQRLYRVFQNLIRNCAQYSLEGSRAYVSLTAVDRTAVVTLKNISKTELSYRGEDLIARFVRGDQNRSTEGSGLGLSIAQSFTEACGGRLSVNVNGDLFTVTVVFPLKAEQVMPDHTEPVQASAE